MVLVGLSLNTTARNPKRTHHMGFRKAKRGGALRFDHGVVKVTWACLLNPVIALIMNAQSFLQFFPQRVPLPPNPFDQVQNASYDAYKCCLEKEIEAGNNPNLLMYARCLGYLLLEAPTPDAQDFLAHQIIECTTQRTDMDMLAEFYINHLFRLCMLFCAI